MQEVKQPNKKPFIFYYMIALIVIILINSLLVPQIVQRAVKEVDYNTFMQMTYDKQIDEVQVQDNQIVFTAKDDKTIYKTGLMDDPDRTQRLYDSGAKFSSEIVEEASPILSFLISWLLPLIIIIGFGQLMYRQMAKKAGGDSMMFGMGGMGKSNAKVYVKSSNGIKFTDVAGEDAHRISRVGEPLLGGSGVYLARNYAGLRDNDEVFRVYLDDTVEPLVGYDDASQYGERTAGEPRAAAARRDRYQMAVGEPQYLRYFTGRGGGDDGLRQVAFVGAQRRGLVARTGLALLVRRPYMCGTDYISQRREYFLRYNAVSHDEAPPFHQIIIQRPYIFIRVYYNIIICV